MGPSKVFKLTELLNTRFLYVTFCLDLNYMFSCCRELEKDPGYTVNAGNEVQEELYAAVRSGITPVFDLDKCKITTDVTTLIFNRQDAGFHFVDTGDAKRNAILIENERRIENGKLETVKLPPFNLKQSIASYINSLQTGALYTYPENSELYRSLIIMTAILRPKVQFAMDNLMAGILTTVSNALTLDTLEQYDEFYYYTTEGVEVLQLDKGILHTQRMGDVTISTASHGGYLVPTIFGKERLYKAEGWDIVFNKALSSVNKLINLRPRTLREVLVED